MEKITLNEYLKQGSVVENLKNFVGVTPENTMGLMTPERLAAVAGGKMPLASATTNGLLHRRYSESFITLRKNEVALIHSTKAEEWDATSMFLYLCSDVPTTILSVVLRSGFTNNICRIDSIQKGGHLGSALFFKEVNRNHIVNFYIQNKSEYNLTIIKKNIFNFNEVYTDIQKSSVDVSGMEKVNVI